MKRGVAPSHSDPHPRPFFQIICDQSSGLQERFAEKDKMENRPLSALISVLDDGPLIA